MEDEDYYRSLSRRALQDLCRKNGLPTNKLKSRMATMLVSYYQNQGASSATLEERSSIPMDESPLTVPVLNVEPDLNLTGEMNEEVHNVRVEAVAVDGRRSPTCSNVAVSTLDAVPKVPSMSSTEVYGFSGVNIQDTAGCSVLGSVLGHKYDDSTPMSRNKDKPASSQRSSLLGHQDDDSTPMLGNKDKPDSDEPIDSSHNMIGPDRSTGLADTPHIEGREKCDVPVDSSVISLDTAKKPPRKFEFYVESEEGIDLTVDFNWNASDWIKSLNDGVCVHPKVPNDKSVELHKEFSTSVCDGTETEASLHDNTVLDSNNKGNLTFTNSLSGSTVKEGNHVKTNKPDSSSSTGIKPINTPVVTLSPVEETTQHNSSPCEPDFDVHNPTDMCNKSSSQTSEKHSQNSVVLLTSQIKSAGNHVIGSKSAGKKSIDSTDYLSKNRNIRPQNIETDSIGTSCISDARGILFSEAPEMMKTFTTVQGNGSGPSGGFPASGNSVGNQLLEVEGLCENMANSHYQNGESQDLNNSNHYLQKETGNCANHELDLNKSLEPLSEGPEEQAQQRSNPTNEVESSECSHVQHLSSIPRMLEFPAATKTCQWRGSYELETHYLEPIKWKRYSNVCTSSVKYDPKWLQDDSQGVFVVTGAQLVTRGNWPKTVLHLRLLFSHLPNCSIQKTEWDLSQATSRKSRFLTNLSTTFTRTEVAGPPKQVPAALNSGVYPDGPPASIHSQKLLRFVDTSEKVRGPHDEPGHWLVIAAKLVTDSHRIGLHVKFALLNYTM